MSDLMANLASGEINFITGLVWVLMAIALSMASGAISAVVMAGKDIGNEFSAIVGAMSGPVGAVPAIVLGLVWLSFLIN